MKEPIKEHQKPVKAKTKDSDVVQHLILTNQTIIMESLAKIIKTLIGDMEFAMKINSATDSSMQVINQFNAQLQEQNDETATKS